VDAVPLVPTTDISEEQPLELEPHPDVVHVPSEEEKQKHESLVPGVVYDKR